MKPRRLRDEVAFYAGHQGDTHQARSQPEETQLMKSVDAAIRQIISQAVVSEDVVDIFAAVGLDKPNIGLLDDEFWPRCATCPSATWPWSCWSVCWKAKSNRRFATNVVQQRKFSELLANVVKRYQNRSIESAQVMEELVEMAKKFREASGAARSWGSQRG